MGSERREKGRFHLRLIQHAARSADYAYQWLEVNWVQSFQTARCPSSQVQRQGPRATDITFSSHSVRLSSSGLSWPWRKLSKAFLLDTPVSVRQKLENISESHVFASCRTVEASLPVDREERHAALSALAEIATGFSPAELGFFARSLELALLERRKGQEVTAGPTRPTRARPLFPDAPMPTPPSARPPAPPPPPSTIGAAPPKPPAPPPPPVAIRAIPPKPPTVPKPSSAAPCGAPAEASPSKELPKDSTPGPLPPEPEPKVLVPDPESESSSSEDENSKPEARALQKKADAEAADKVYELCRVCLACVSSILQHSASSGKLWELLQALAEKPCQVDGKLQADNIRCSCLLQHAFISHWSAGNLSEIFWQWLLSLCTGRRHVAP